MSDTNGTLKALYSLVGKEAVLLPLPFRRKHPDWPEWQRTTFEATQQPDYQSRVHTALDHRGNIGVLLGPPSGNLAAIDLDDDALVDEFLALNPALKETLRSRGARGCWRTSILGKRHYKRASCTPSLPIASVMLENFCRDPFGCATGSESRHRPGGQGRDSHRT